MSNEERITKLEADAQRQQRRYVEAYDLYAQNPNRDTFLSATVKANVLADTLAEIAYLKEG